MPTAQILQYLKSQGEKLDTEIAEAVGMSLAITQIHLSELAAKGAVMSCLSIRFVGTKKIEGMSYRILGFIPKAKPGAKPKVQLKLS